jgi:putative nucleotidyltransferase with HDIG domain
VANILLVGEDRTRTAGFKSLLAMDGHRVFPVRESERWREAEKDAAPEVIVLAAADPASYLAPRRSAAHGFPAPILLVQQASDEMDAPHIEERIVDRIASPFAAEDLLGRVDALIRVRRVVLRHDGSSLTDVGGPVNRMTTRLRAMLSTRVPRFAKPPAPYLEVAARVADWSDRRDGFEPGHAERVTAFSAMIADELDLSDADASSLLRAAMLHDIGKVALPVEILRRQGPLEDAQIRLLRSHAERGASILRALDRDDAVAESVLYHHEHVDGNGYFGRRGEDIPLHARILAVAEGYDAMTTSLTRKPLSGEAAMGLMQDRRGGQWDPTCVDALTRALRPRPRTVALG